MLEGLRPSAGLEEQAGAELAFLVKVDGIEEVGWLNNSLV